MRGTALNAFAHATATGYLWIAPALAVGIGLALFLKPARKPTEVKDDPTHSAGDARTPTGESLAAV